MGSLRDWLAQVEKMGELRLLEGADWNHEVGAITHLAAKQKSPPAVLFDHIKDYPPGYRVLVGMHTGYRRLALTSNLSPDLALLDVIKAWRVKLTRVSRVEPKEISTAAFFENVHEGSDVNVLEFPVPRWHEHDGGRYVGTAAGVITRDPNTGVLNMGCYRVMVHDEGSLGVWMNPKQDGRRHLAEYTRRGESAPIAISIGHHPAVFCAAAMDPPSNLNELEFAGNILGEPIEVVRGPITGLPIPAGAEIVIEGEVRPGEKRLEGPFGEATGYYGSSAREEPIIRIKAIYHRHDPILAACPTHKAPHDHTLQTTILRSAALWNDIEAAGVPGVKAVYRPALGGGATLILISIKQHYPGHARQAAYVASQCGAGAYHGRFTFVFDEDVDITDMTEVLWAMLTRTDPENDIEVMRRCVSSALDPIIPKSRKGFNSRAIVDACRPWEWKDEFPLVAEPGRELAAATLKKWGGAL